CHAMEQSHERRIAGDQAHARHPCVRAERRVALREQVRAVLSKKLRERQAQRIFFWSIQSRTRSEQLRLVLLIKPRANLVRPKRRAHRDGIHRLRNSAERGERAALSLSEISRKFFRQPPRDALLDLRARDSRA